MGSELTPEVLADLRAKASAATPGPWRTGMSLRHATREDLLSEIATQWLLPAGHPECDPDFFGVVSGRGDDARMPCVTGNGPTSRWNALFIAAANPATVIALLDEIEVWRKTSQTALESSIRTSLTSEVMRASIRDAFDAGARAMRDAVLEQGDDATHAPDIANLPGRPE